MARALLAWLLLAAWCAYGQAQKLEPRGLKLAEHYPPPNESQVKSLLEGGRVQQPEAGYYLFSGGTTLSTFLTNGEPQVIIKADQCLYNYTAQVANSAGPLRVQTADGKFLLEGEGFLWLRTNSTLFISNRVHTVVQPEMFESQERSRNEAAKGASEPADIRSDRFLYNGDSGLGIYEQNVRVTQGTNLAMSSGTLEVLIPLKERQLRQLTADREVRIHYNEVDATGEHAVYAADSGMVHITGHPAWQALPREGRGDELVIDRSNRVFQANGNAWLRFPGQSAGMGDTLSRSSQRAPGPALATNEIFEISSGRYEFHTNWAVFQKEVRVTELLTSQVRGTMNCELLTAAFAGSNELQRLTADQNVTIRQETNWLTGQHAVYTTTNGILEMTGNPAWRVGTREGRGDVIQLSTNGEMRVRGNARIRIPAGEMGQTALMGPGKTNVPASSNFPANSKPLGVRDFSAPGTARPESEWAEVFCEEYVLRRELSVFLGGVYVSHPRMYWLCERMAVRTPEPGNRIIVAEEGVKFDLVDDRGQKVHGTGDNAVYTYSVTTGPDGRTTNELVHLTGNPAVLETENMTNRNYNGPIILDLLRHKLISQGSVQGSITNANTNLFGFPHKKVTK